MEKFACVTGADRGVGLELANQLLARGYKVFAGRILKDWKLLDDLKEKYKEKLYILPLDISSDSSARGAAELIASNTSELELLINNGAILGDIKGTILDKLDFEEMQRVFNVTALGALRVSNALAPLLLKGDRRLIVNISSEAGSINDSYRKSWFAYCMSKAALNMESVIIHNQLKEMGGQVLVIHPGWVKTYMQGKLDEAADLTPEDSAKHIVEVIFDHKRYFADKPAFVDYLGNKMEW
ncbi:MAG: SDR family oxidoreductase [Bacillota bacterium]|nr:SDR family oxidoreductase [Bacillota bacterium]